MKTPVISNTTNIPKSHRNEAAHVHGPIGVVKKLPFGLPPPKAAKRTNVGAPKKSTGRWKGGSPKGTKNKSDGKPKSKTYSDELIAKALWKCHGMRSHAANLLGMDIGHCCNRILKSPFLLRAVEAAKEQLLDSAETGLRKGTERGKGWAVMFALDRLGSKRGYIRQELLMNGTNGTGTGIPTDLAEWPKNDLDRLIAALSSRLDKVNEGEEVEEAGQVFQ